MKRNVAPHVPPPAAAEREYKKDMQRAVRAMMKSVQLTLAASYERAFESNVEAGNIADGRAYDASPFEDQRALFEMITQLRDRWVRYFNDRAGDLARGVVTSTYRSNTRSWSSGMRAAGFDVPMQLTQAQRVVMDVKVQENVSLIRTIPEQYFGQVENAVSEGFLAGRDLHAISTKLRELGEVPVKRAANIARDQCNKLTAQMNATRQNELGIRYAYWRHSSAGIEPRVNHARAAREKWIYDTQVGIDFGDKFGFVLPGVAINCRCTTYSILPLMDPISPEDLTPVAGFPGAFTRKSDVNRKTSVAPQYKVATRPKVTGTTVSKVTKVAKKRVAKAA